MHDEHDTRLQPTEDGDGMEVDGSHDLGSRVSIAGRWLMLLRQWATVAEDA
jgi:hypothetical protein